MKTRSASIWRPRATSWRSWAFGALVAAAAGCSDGHAVPVQPTWADVAPILHGDHRSTARGHDVQGFVRVSPACLAVVVDEPVGIEILDGNEQPMRGEIVACGAQHRERERGDACASPPHQREFRERR